MATPKSIICTYESEALSFDVPFRTDGFFNATAVAKQFGKRPNDWLGQDGTKDYITQVIDFLSLQSGMVVEQNQLVTTINGGKSPGTWLHPKLGVAFARWLNTRFAVWCDLQIDAILRGEVKLVGAKAYQEAEKILASMLRMCNKLGVDDHMALAVSAEHARRATDVDLRPLLKTVNLVADPPMNLGELGELIGVSNRRMGTILTEQGFRAKDETGEYVPTEKGRKHCTFNPYQSENSDHTGYQCLWYRTVLDALEEPVT